ncbi:envelope protein [Myodes rufocanus vole coronavirus 2/JL2014]|uniref:Envelope small membrane protein n=1 Tax=Myodes rufocanus vole coronavirus 2/JL2014 TaxID=2847997 RepID=A0A2H4N004_9BETC|nr:envelope protein [Rodent coronavirus]ATP66745.1 envelope protein [Myodes rufocanus vole coronavirus 2/JL2014]
MAEIYLSDTVWYVGQIIFIFAICLFVIVVVVAFLATFKLCVQLCGICNTLVLSPSIYVYNRGRQFYEFYQDVKPPVLEMDDV